MNRRTFLQSVAAAFGSTAFGTTEARAENRGEEITVKEFRDWLQGFMVYGSDQKELICDPVSYNAICSMPCEWGKGFQFSSLRIVNDQQYTLGEYERWLMTPFGFIKLVRDERSTEITVIDPPVRHRRKFGLPNQDELERHSEGRLKSIYRLLA